MRNRFIYLAAIVGLCVSAIGLVTLPGVLPPRYIRHSASDQKKASDIKEAPPDMVKKNDIDPTALARSFHIYSPQKTEEAKPVLEVKTPPPPTAADWIKPLGTISDESGTIRFYFKNTKNGKLLRIRSDGKEENGQAILETTGEQYLILLDGERYYVKRSKK